MGFNIGPTISVKGEAEYISAMKNIKANMKLIASEASVMTANFKGNESSVQALTAKGKVLNEALKTQKAAVKEAEDALQRMKNAGVDPSSQAYVAMQTNLNNAKAAVISTTNEIKQNETALKNGEKGTGKFAEGLKNVAEVAGKVAVVALKAFAVAAGAVTAAMGVIIAKFVSGIKETAKFGDEIDKNSQRLGLSREAYQEWEFVLSQSGVNINTMQVGLKTLTNTIDDARNGVKPAIEKFDRLGISIKDIADKSREDIFAETIKGLQSMTDDTAKAALANDLFGRSGQEILPLLNQTAESTDALMKKARDYGFVMSDEAVTASVNFTDSLDLLKHTATGLKNNLMAEFLPAVTQITDGLALLFTGDTSGLEGISDGIRGVIDKLSEMMPEIVSVGGSVVEALVASILDNLPSFISDALPPMIESASKLIELLFSTIVETLPNAVPAIIEATANVLRSVLEILQQNAAIISDAAIQIVMMFITFMVDNLPMVIETGLDILIAVSQGILENIPAIIPAIVEMITGIALAITEPNTLAQLAVASLDIIIAVAQGLLNALPQLLEAALQIVVNLALAFGQAAPQLWEKGKEFIVQLGEGVWAQLSTLFTQIGGWISTNIIKPVTDKVDEFLSIGKNMVEGLWNGINDKMQWIKNKISEWVGNVIRFFKNLLGIQSPSTVFKEMGNMSAEGYALGWAGNMGSILGTLSRVKTAATNVLSGGIKAALENVSGAVGSVGLNVSASGSAPASVAPAPNYIFNIYAKDKDTAIEVADATVAVMQTARWVTP